MKGEIAKCKYKLDSLEKLIEEVSIEDIRALFLKQKKFLPATIEDVLFGKTFFNALNKFSWDEDNVNTDNVTTLSVLLFFGLYPS